MKKENPHKKVGTQPCDVCSSLVEIDRFYQGVCSKCEWNQSELSADNPSKVAFPNVMSLNNAKRLFNEGKLIKPTLEDFASMFNFYGEVQFWHRGKRFGLVASNGKTLEFYQWNIEESYQTFNSTQEFIEKANIGGQLLRDVWHEVENAEYMT